MKSFRSSCNSNSVSDSNETGAPDQGKSYFHGPEPLPIRISGSQFAIDGHGHHPNLLVVSSRLLKWLALVTLIFVLGAHWAILQSVAWVTMVAGYSQAEPISEALVKTFDGKHPCPLCKFVAKGKNSERKQETQKLLTKFDFFLSSSLLVLFPPARDPLHVAHPRSADPRSQSPPTPPPRISHG